MDRPAGVPGAADHARVSEYVDGDTLRLAPVGQSAYLAQNRETTVRFLEIDTPESVDPSSPDECYAKRAAAGLRDLAGSTVWIAADEERRDPYDRTLLYRLFIIQGVVGA